MNVAYTVRSGSMRYEHRTAMPADAQAVALVALEIASTSDGAKTLGRLLEVSGGDYIGDEVVYFDTTKLLQKLGRMA
jgi:hypothetical protein